MEVKNEGAQETHEPTQNKQQQMKEKKKQYMKEYNAKYYNNKKAYYKEYNASNKDRIRMNRINNQIRKQKAAKLADAITKKNQQLITEYRKKVDAKIKKAAQKYKQDATKKINEYRTQQKERLKKYVAKLNGTEIKVKDTTNNNDKIKQPEEITPPKDTPEKIAERNKERIRQYAKEYYAKNKDKIKASCQKRDQELKEQLKDFEAGKTIDIKRTDREICMTCFPASIHYVH